MRYVGSLTNGVFRPSFFFVMAWLLAVTSVPSLAEYGNPDRPGGYYGNVIYRAIAQNTSDSTRVVAVGRAWNGSQYKGVIASFLTNGGWHDSGFTNSGGGWFPGQQFYDFAGAGYDNLCNAVVYAYDGWIVACRSLNSAAYYDVFLAKVDSNGNLMSAFGTNGIIETNIGGNSTSGHALVNGIAYNGDVNTSDHGVITLVGYMGKVGSYHPYIAAFDQKTGAQFGSTVTLSSFVGTAVGIAYNSNGASSAYYVAVTESSAPHHFYVYNFYHDSGTPSQIDTAGGNWGKAINFVPEGGGTESQPNGIAVFGSDVVIVGSNKVNSSTPPWNCAVAAVAQSNGSLDTSFGSVSITGGTNGQGVTLFSLDGATPVHDCILNSVIPNGSTNLFLLGTSYIVGRSNYDYLASYLNSSGTLVGSFGSSGVQTLGLGPADDDLNSAVIISGTVYLAGRSQNSALYNGGDIESINLGTAAFPQTVSSFTVTPTSGSLYTGQTTGFTVTATYSDNSTASVPSGSVKWTASGSAISVSSAGVASPTGTTGSSTVTATLPNSVMASATVTNTGYTPSIFATTNAYAGNIGGLYFADYACQLEANSASLAGTWKAILSTSTINASTHVTLGQAFNNMNSTPQLVTISNSLWSGNITNAIGYSAGGASVGTTQVWTGSNTSGAYASNSCSDWTRTSGTGAYGYTETGSYWVSWSNIALYECLPTLLHRPASLLDSTSGRE